MIPLRIRPYAPADADEVVQLWRDCDLVRPQNDPLKDIQRKMAFQPGLFFVAESAGRIIGTVMAGYEGHRGWINYLATAPSRQRQGIGRQLMETAEAALRELGCAKINLQVRATNQTVLTFYETLGFQHDQVVSMGKRLEHDTPDTPLEPPPPAVVS